MKIRRILAAFLAILTVASASGCAISAALEEDGGFKFVSTQVSKEESTPEIKLHNMPEALKVFGGVSAPAIFSDYTGTPYETVEGDLYVSPDGNDETGDGSKEKPYATFEKAKSAVREIKAAGKLPKGTFTVVFMPGEYRISEGLVFTEEDSGTEDCTIIYAAYDAREVVFKGTTKLNASDFTAVGEDIKAILPDESKDKVLMVDLKKYGITADQLGIKGISQETWMNRYSPAHFGVNVEFFFNREAFTLARYPNEGTLLVIDSIVDQGNPDALTPGIFKMKAADVNRVKSWHSTEGVWVQGRFFVDWATMSSQVSFDLDEATATFDFNCFYNALNDTPYHFYNVLDELDIPGEWYLDRENCILYMYPTGDMADAELEMLVEFGDDMVRGDKLAYVTFMGLTFMGGKESGMLIYNSNNIHLDRCKFYGFSGDFACEIGGENCSMVECEAHYNGRDGLAIFGGDDDTLTPSNSYMENCYVTHWGLVTTTFAVGLSVGGVETVMRYCEAAYSSANAVAISQVGSIIEYNLFHDCTTWSTDCGTLYIGSSMMHCPNNELRYNIFYNIGNDWAKTAALFWDDGHGSQRAYGNLFVNIAGNGITTGGGRNHTFLNNIIINVGRNPFYYDQRPYDNYMNHGRFNDNGFYDLDGGYMWENFANVPQTQVWYEAIAYLQQVITNDSDLRSPHFMYNPSMSLYVDNIIVNKSTNIGNVFEQPRQYSTYRDNYLASLSAMSEIFVDPDNGDYRLKDDAPIYEMIPKFKETSYYLVGRK